MKRLVILVGLFCLISILFMLNVSSAIYPRCSDADKNVTYPDGINIYESSFITYRNSFSSPTLRFNDSCYDLTKVNETYCCSGLACISPNTPSSKLVACPPATPSCFEGRCISGVFDAGVQLTYPLADPTFVENLTSYHAFACKNLSAMKNNKIYFYSDIYGSLQRVVSSNLSCKILPPGIPVPPGVAPCPPSVPQGSYAFVLSTNNIFGPNVPFLNISALENGDYKWNCEYDYLDQWNQTFIARASQDKNIRVLISSGNKIESSGFVDVPVSVQEDGSKELVGGWFGCGATLLSKGPILRDYFKFYNSTMNLILPPNPSESEGVVYSIVESPNLSVSIPQKGVCSTINGSYYKINITPNLNFAGQTYIKFKATLGSYSGMSDRLIVNVQGTADSPVFDSGFTSISWGSNENKTVNLNNYFSDPDGDILTYSISPTTFNGMDVLLTGSSLKLSSINGFIGTNYVNITAKDPSQNSVTALNVLLQSIAPNQLPVILSHMPNESSITIEKGQSKTFSISKMDPNNDSLTTKWYVNFNVVSTGYDSYSFSSSLVGDYLLKVKVYETDNSDNSNNFVWNIHVVDSGSGGGGGGGACTPSCANAINVCAGQTFSDGCLGYCEGQKDCSQVVQPECDSDGDCASDETCVERLCEVKDQTKVQIGQYFLYGLIGLLIVLIIGVVFYLLVVLKKGKNLR